MGDLHIDHYSSDLCALQSVLYQVKMKANLYKHHYQPRYNNDDSCPRQVYHRIPCGVVISAFARRISQTT
jgi:hypothetical protein